MSSVRDASEAPAQLRYRDAPMRMLRQLVGPFFLIAGVLHFVIPRPYRKIVPPWVPAPKAIVYLSGAAEIAGGVGMMVPGRRRLAGWWLIATMIGVFPANVHMAMNAEDYPAVPGGALSLWARLPFQGVFVAWILDAMTHR
jgi:uncharacterized membrane protein